MTALPVCRVCGVQFHEGEEADASDWTVLDLEHLSSRMVTRYQHVTCPDPTPWRCELHGVTTTGDCPRCDDDMEALS
jgi:hypothetical protein